MALRFEKKQFFPCLIAVSCLFPLFAYCAYLCLMKKFQIIVFFQISGGVAALAAFVVWWIKEGRPPKIWFWALLSVSPLGISLIFLLKFYSNFLFILFLAIHFLFPMVHILLETRKRKKWFRYLLFCIYIFSLFMGSTILVLGKMSYVEFFPIAALSGCLLELSFLWTKQTP